MSRPARPEGRSGVRRRRALAWLGSAPLAGAVAAQPAGRADGGTAGAALEALRAGGVALLLRHATTTPGIGDPPGLRLGDCATQRNLSDAGRAEARRIGAWFERHRLVPAQVRSSAWCRCIDTARLAFGDDVRHWAPLDSSFGRDGASDEPARLRGIDEALRAIGAGRFEVWVTHQVNITAATGEFVGMGAGVLVRAADAAGRVPAGESGGGAAAARPLVVARMVAFDA